MHAGKVQVHPLPKNTYAPKGEGVDSVSERESMRAVRIHLLHLTLLGAGVLKTCTGNSGIILLKAATVAKREMRESCQSSKLLVCGRL